MSFLQLVLSFDKTIKEIILLWRICQFDRYRNSTGGGGGPQVNKFEEVSNLRHQMSV